MSQDVIEIEAELRSLQERQRALQAALEERKRNQRAEYLKTAKAEIEATLTKFGLTLHEVFPALARPAASTESSPRRKRPPVQAKYQSLDGTRTWSGRGLKPRWFIDAEKQGTVEQLLIQKG